MFYLKKSEHPCPRCNSPEAIRTVDSFDGQKIVSFDCPECGAVKDPTPRV